MVSHRNTDILKLIISLQKYNCTLKTGDWDSLKIVREILSPKYKLNPMHFDVCIEKNVNNAGKAKKFDKKECPQPKERVEKKKTRPQVQQNRFTNVLELSTLSASLMQLNELFGTLILDFSQDPVQMKISDVTGNYELNVPKVSLNEFKIKVLLGQDVKGKPSYTIFLGECQCYPALPEGAIKTEQNDNSLAQIESIFEEYRNETKMDVASGVTDEEKVNAVEAPQPTPSTSDDMLAHLAVLFENESPKNAEEKQKNSVTYDTHHISIPEPQILEPTTTSDELIVKMRPKRVVTRLRSRCASKKPILAAARKPRNKYPSFKNGLEGFVKFLMADGVCGSFLDKVGKQKMVNYSKGQEFRMTVSDDAKISNDANEEVKQQEDVESTSGIKVLFERPPFEKTDLVEKVKKEIEEWQARGEQTVNVEIVEDASSSSEDANVVTVYEDPKTSKKLEDDTNSRTELDSDSMNKLFLDLNKKEESELSLEQTVMVEKNGVFAKMKAEKISTEYVTPIPLETTSTADIETMWMSFVEMFHRRPESATKLLSSCESSNTPKKPDAKQIRNCESTRDIACSYPGQHCLPYFVEESLKRVNSMLESWHPPNPLPTVTKKSLDTICPPQTPLLSRFKGDPSPGKFFFNPKHHDVQIDPPFHKHPPLPGKFSRTKSRIFFNPHVSIGDWY